MLITLRSLLKLTGPSFGKRSALLALGCVLAMASTGCGRSDWGNNEDATPFTPRTTPVSVGGDINLTPKASSSPADDPQISHGGDPMVDAADPLAASPSPFDSTGSRLTDSRDPGAAKNSSQTQGWYWVVGDVQSGQVAISVNGTPIGRYSVHVDKEITAYCHPGLNTLTFTHYPLLGSAQHVCDAHLEILNGHAPKGAPPLLVYDTSDEESAPAAPAANTPADSSGGGVIDSDSSQEPDSDAGSVPIVPSNNSAVSGATAAPYTDERSFSGS